MLLAHTQTHTQMKEQADLETLSQLQHVDEDGDEVAGAHLLGDDQVATIVDDGCLQTQL